MAVRMMGRLVLLVLAVLAACGPSEPPARRRVVVIGIDGADWAVIDRLRAEKRVPVLDGLIARGARGQLGTFKPTLSPALWTTVATGMPADVHGIPNFVLQRPVVDLPIGSLPPTTLDLVADLRIARGCDAAGLELFVNDTRLARVRTEGTTLHAEVPPAPRRERRKGETLTIRLRHPCPPPADPMAPPKEWARLGAIRLLDHDGRVAAEPDATALGRANGVRPADGALDLVALRTEQVESSDRLVPALWNIATARERSVDVVGWWCTWPAEAVRGTLVSDFLFFASTRRLLSLGAPEVMFDEGAVHPAADVDIFAEALSPKWQLDAATLERFVPRDSPRFAEHLAVPARVHSLSDSPLTVLKDTYLQNRPHFTAARALAGRRHDLLLVYTNFVDAVEHKFWRWYEPARFPDTAPEDVADFGDTIPRAYVWVDTEIGEILKRAGDDATVLVLSDHGHHAAKPGGAFSGEHSDAPPGILIAAGPGVPAGTTIRNATLLDIAPTVLTLLGLPPASDMPGRVLRELIPGSREFDRVPTYKDVPREGPSLPAAGALDPSVRERLRSLGYLGE
jgi:hypothetical protein